MRQEKMDRRIRYTKHILQETMVDLLEIYPASKISVSMLCEKADLNRSTFYAHYENVPQLLEQMEHDAMSNLQDCITSHTEIYKEANLEQIMVQILEYVSENTRLFRVLLGKNTGWDFNGVMINLLNTELTGIISPELGRNKVMFDYVIEFSVSGATSVIQHWLKKGAKESPKQMANIITHMLMKSVAMI